MSDKNKPDPLGPVGPKPIDPKEALQADREAHLEGLQENRASHRQDSRENKGERRWHIASAVQEISGHERSE